jgi:hypothetical protein
MEEESGLVSVEHLGKTYEGTYSVSGDIVTVTYDERSQSTEVGNLGARAVAQLLLKELVRTGHA